MRSLAFWIVPYEQKLYNPRIDRMDMKSLSTVDIYFLLQELQFLVNAKIDKIYMPQKMELLLQLHIPGQGKKILRIVAGKLLYLSEFKPPSEDPSGFCMYLRKHVYGRIRSMKQIDAERIIEIDVENKNGHVSIIAELYGKGNIIIVKNGIIMNAAERQSFKDRSVIQKQEYIYPHQKYNFKTITLKEVKTLLQHSTKESLVKSVALDLGLGGVYAEKVCEGLDKNMKPSEAKSSLIYDALQELKNNPRPINRELDLLYTQKQEENLFHQEIDMQTKEQKKFQKIIESQEKVIEKMKHDESFNSEAGEFIFTHYGEIQNILQLMKKKIKNHSLQELNKEKPNHVIDINPKEKTITIEL